MTRSRLLVGLAALLAAVVIVVVVTDGRETSRRATVPTLAPTVSSDAVEPAPLDDDAWSRVLGSWTIDGASARVDTVDTDAPTFLVTDTVSPDYTVRARLDVAALTSGLVFRYRDPANYWALGGVPTLGVWRVYKVVDGEEVDVGLFEEPICCSAGVLTSASTTREGSVVVSIDSLLLLDIRDPELADTHHAGVYALGDDAVDAHLSSIEVIDRVPSGGVPSAPRRVTSRREPG